MSLPTYEQAIAEAKAEGLVWNDDTGKWVKECELCGGTGEYLIPAAQEAGRIVDGQIIKCSCQNDTSINSE